MTSPQTSDLPTVPFTLTRAGVIMSPEPGNEFEAEGVLNPASGRGPDGQLYLLPRLVAKGNVSRVGLAKVDHRGRRPHRRRARRASSSPPTRAGNAA